ncbi:hypothetical protein [Robbsia sp. KACC 23696]|uniref:hypothetical protein n=1 Tax=Robbsia sp. KACC 23696 TaxID=3149231 RepID=UPI00325B3514
MRNLDFSSWQAMLSTLLGLAIITLLGVGIRLLVMQVVQQRRERQNRQINERLRTLIAAYKTLGGSFTGNLDVDPTHLRDLKRASMAVPPAAEAALDRAEGAAPLHGPIDEAREPGGSDRSRRIRDAVEGALADIILLGTEEQVRLAAEAAQQMIQGHTVHTAALVVSLRDFIRKVLDLDRMPGDITIPPQGPARPAGGKGKEGGGGDGSGKNAGGGGGGGGGGSGSMPAHASGAGHHSGIDDTTQAEP